MICRSYTLQGGYGSHVIYILGYETARPAGKLANQCLARIRVLQLGLRGQALVQLTYAFRTVFANNRSDRLPSHKSELFESLRPQRDYQCFSYSPQVTFAYNILCQKWRRARLTHTVVEAVGSLCEYIDPDEAQLHVHTLDYEA